MKRFFINVLIWIAGCVIFSFWLLWDLERNPVLPNADGAIPDSPSLPIVIFAILFLLVIIIINLGLWIKRRF